MFDNTYSDASQSDAVYYPDEMAEEVAIGKNAPFSVSVWVYRHDDSKWMAAVIKVSNENWTDGWGLEHRSGSGSNIDFFVGDYNTYARASLSNNTWTHVLGTYDGTNIRIYTNGTLQDTQAQNSYSAGSRAVTVGDDTSGESTDDRWQGALDEVKIWRRALSDTEVQTIYNNENSGLNFNATTRTCTPCSSTPIEEKSWSLIGIPADSRTSPLTIEDVFGDDMMGEFNTDWRIYKRTYDTTENSSVNEWMQNLTDEIEFGQGYWLGSRLAERWDVDGTNPVNYDSANPDCPSDKCVEIELTSAVKNFGEPDNDPADGSGPYLYNMNGFIGMDKPVDWADCRFIVDGTAYTPSDANASGLAGKQVWLYNPDESSANGNGYTTCADDSPGGCKLVPFNGFWVQLHGKTKNKTVKLLIPQE